jgi:hypothetical protein
MEETGAMIGEDNGGGSGEFHVFIRVASLFES